jgi:OmcA/MtrC family decaheme c-type cytochrome
MGALEGVMKNWIKLLAMAIVAGSLAFAGCSGDDGRDGRDGRDGVDGQDGADGADGAPGEPAIPPVLTSLSSESPHFPENATRMAPESASCYGCHNTPAALAHFDLNTSYTFGAEACSICHSPGAILPAHASFDPQGQFNFLDGEITAVAIDDENGAEVTVTFAVTQGGAPVTGLQSFEFTIAKLNTGGDYPDWQSYINRSIHEDDGARVLRAAGERATPAEIAPGVYEYTFCTDLVDVENYIYNAGAAANDEIGAPGCVSGSGILDSPAWDAIEPTLDVSYNPAATHRISISLRQTGQGLFWNGNVDFVPETLPALLPATADLVATTESCGSCHGLSEDRSKLYFPGFHAGGSRITVELCVTCHNASTFDSETSTDTAWASLDLVNLVHKIHVDNDYEVAGRDYSTVHYPQSVTNCLTCHDNQRMAAWGYEPAGRSEADKTAYQDRPSAAACGTCHEIDFNAHFSSGGVTAACLQCHGPGQFASVDEFHISVASTPNNPWLPEGGYEFQYSIDSVTLDDELQPTIKFAVYARTEPGAFAPLNFSSLPAGVTLGNVRFYAAFSVPQPEPPNPRNGPAIDAPQDFNNLYIAAGRQYFDFAEPTGLFSWDQPAALGTLTSFLDALEGPDANGYYTLELPFNFPVDSTLRAVSIEGRPTSAAGNAQTPSVIKHVGPERRKVVDINNCNTCHERIVFHGGGRMDGVDHCVSCHNPEMTNSNLFSGIIPEGAFEEFPARQVYEGMFFTRHSNNLKDMLHGIHAGQPVSRPAIRTVPFNFIRANALAPAGGQGPHPFADVGFPAVLRDCQACHIDSSYALPITPGALWTVMDVNTPEE